MTLLKRHKDRLGFLSRQTQIGQRFQNLGLDLDVDRFVQEL